MMTLMNWILKFWLQLIWPSIDGAGPTVATGSGGNTGGSPSPGGAQPGTGQGAGTGTTAQPTAQPGAQGGSPSPTGTGTGAIDWTTAPAHFRTAYEQLRAERERYAGLGEFEQVQGHVQLATTMANEAFELGRGLGYSDAAITRALQADVIQTLTFLRGRQGQQGSQGQGQGGRQGQGQGEGQGQSQPTVEDMIRNELAPVNQFMSEQMADMANSAFRGEFDRLGADPQIGYGPEFQALPQSVKDLFYDALSEVFKYDANAMKALKFQRDVRPVAKTFAEVKGRLEKAFMDWHQYQLAKAGGGGGQGQGARQGQAQGQGQGTGNNGNGRPFTLDDIIYGNENAVNAIPSMRR